MTHSGIFGGPEGEECVNQHGLLVLDHGPLVLYKFPQQDETVFKKICFVGRSEERDEAVENPIKQAAGGPCRFVFALVAFAIYRTTGRE